MNETQHLQVASNEDDELSFILKGLFTSLTVSINESSINNVISLLVDSSLHKRKLIFNFVKRNIEIYDSMLNRRQEVTTPCPWTREEDQRRRRRRSLIYPSISCSGFLRRLPGFTDTLDNVNTSSWTGVRHVTDATVKTFCKVRRLLVSSY